METSTSDISYVNVVDEDFKSLETLKLTNSNPNIIPQKTPIVKWRGMTHKEKMAAKKAAR